MSRFSKFFLVSLIVLVTENAWAAQSTADVPITGELRTAAREKVLGKGVAVSSEEQYVIGHGDVLSIQVYGEGEMSATLPAATSATAGRGQQAEDSLRTSPGVQVRIDGRISLKHIGDVDAVGFTLTQLADYLKELYSSVFSDPNITVVLVQSNSQRYTVMGKVAKPGVYYLDYPINIVQTVARCGGFAEWAKSKVTLVRKEPKKDRKLFKGNTLLFDYGDFLDGTDLEKNLFIEPGDIIIVN
jgi:polysaccharide export outer membrane protein